MDNPPELLAEDDITGGGEVETANIWFGGDQKVQQLPADKRRAGSGRKYKGYVYWEQRTTI